MRYAIFWWSSATMGTGTKSLIGASCGLVRGNPQWPGILDLFSESKLSQSDFMVDMKEQFTTQSQIAFNEKL